MFTPLFLALGLTAYPADKIDSFSGVMAHVKEVAGKDDWKKGAGPVAPLQEAADAIIAEPKAAGKFESFKVPADASLLVSGGFVVG